MSDPAIAMSSDSTAETEAWKKLASLALVAVAKHPVEFSSEESNIFSGRILATLAALEDQARPSQILIAAGSVAEAIDQYNNHAQSRLDNLVGQFRALAQLLLGRSHGVPVSFRGQLDAALAITELSEMEEKLQQCLQAARNLPAAPALPAAVAASGADLATGLPTRAEADAAIRRAMSGSAQVYVAAFYIHRMNLINARFGDAIGNQVILFCSQYIATNLPGANDQLFRWRGPGFVAVIERSDSPLVVASEMQRFTSVPLSRFFETPSRTVYLPIKLTGEVLPTAGKTADEVIDEVQKLLHAHGAAEP